MKRSFRRAIAIFAGTLVVLGAAVAYATSVTSNYAMTLHADTKTNCLQLEQVKKEIRLAITVQLTSLGRRGSSGYVYYTTHPDELAFARRAATNELQTFHSTACP